MNILETIKIDLKRNSDIKMKFVLILFRIGNISYFQSKIKILYYLFKPLYKVFVEYLLNIELPMNTSVGIGLRIDHGHCLVVNHKSIIGDFVTLKHNTTIGCKTNLKNKCIKQTIINNNVIIHPHSCIIGVTIGENSIVGAGSIVVKDVFPDCIVAGNPAKILRNLN